MQQHTHALQTWKKFAPFQVFGDYAPMPGFYVVVQVGAMPQRLQQVIEHRASNSELLDPGLARCTMRAGLSLSQSGLVSFVYATCEETVVVVRPEVSQGQGEPGDVQHELMSTFSARLSLLVGQELPAFGRVYEFPDMQVVRRALSALAEEVEETTPLRSAMWLGAQLRGRGQAFHPSMVETLEEQSSLLQSHGINMDALPAWWWRGVVSKVDDDGSIAIFDELPGGDDFGAMLDE